LRPSTLARKIAALTLLKKAHDLVIMDLRKLTSMTDFFVICSADSDVQVKAIADAVEEGMEKEGSVPWHREAGSANWILMDYVDVVLHIFHRHTRTFYNLEKLWGDAKVQRVTDRTTAGVKRKARVPRTTRRTVSRKTAVT
jgi:ribosome-associated protein